MKPNDIHYVESARKHWKNTINRWNRTCWKRTVKAAWLLNNETSADNAEKPFTQ